MKKLIILSLLVISASLRAADWSSKGFTIIESRKDSADITTDTLEDDDGNQFTVNYSGEIPEYATGIIKKLNTDFRSWESMKVEYIKFSITNGEIQILVAPSKYTFKDENLLDHISSGILFTYRTNLIYNFRILVNNLFVPIKGIYIDEMTLNQKILSAINDPTTYINARDPEYLLEKLDKLSAEFERLRAAHLAGLNFNKFVDKEIIDAVLDVKSQNPDFNFKDIGKELKERDIKVSPDLIRNILKIYYNEF